MATLRNTNRECPFKLASHYFQVLLLVVMVQIYMCQGIPHFETQHVLTNVELSLIQKERFLSRYRPSSQRLPIIPLNIQHPPGTESINKFLLESVVPSYLSTFLRNETAKHEFLAKLEVHLINPNQEDEGTPPCATHFIHLFETLAQIVTNLTGVIDQKNTWALQMVDSWGKIPEGILSGHLNAYGDYDECVGVEVNDNRVPEGSSGHFQGMYCWTYIILAGGQNKVNVETRKSVSVEDLLYYMLHPTAAIVAPSSAFCVPSTCSTDQFQTAVYLLFETLFPNAFPFVAFCQVKEDTTFDTGAKVMIGVLSVLGLIIMLGSLVDVILNGRFVPSEDPNQFQAIKKRLPTRLLLSFSLPTNIRKWANTSSGDSGFACIHGIRFFSTCWVLLSHTIFLLTMQGPAWNTIDVTTIYKRPWHFYVLLNGYFSVDTFFTMSGLLASYSLMKALDKQRGRINIFKLYLHRYLRLTPTYALIICLLATLFPYLSSGPFFSMNAEGISKMCKKYWWHNLLYLNNVYKYTDGDAMCEGESWYIANDMQFFILAPLFVFLLWKWKLIGMAVLGSASLASILAPGIVIGTEGLPPTQIFWKMGTSSNPRAMEVYMHPWFRIGPYFVGIWMGYFLHKLGNKPIRINRLGVLGGWMLSTSTSLALILGVIPNFDPEYKDNPITSGIYGGLSRFCWGIVICWVIFACVKGYGGWINEFLSWKAWVPLGRLTFCVYLSSLSVQMMLQLSLRQPMSFDMYTVTNMFFSHLLMCFLVGFVLSMIFESPFIALEKVIMGGTPPRENKSTHQNCGLEGIGFQNHNNSSIIYGTSTIPRVKTTSPPSSPETEMSYTNPS